MYWSFESDGAAFYSESKTEDNFAMYGDAIEEANNAVYRLIMDIDSCDCSDGTCTELTLMVEDETDDLQSIELINWEDEEEVRDQAYIAEDIIDFCNHFFDIYAPMVAEII